MLPFLFLSLGSAQKRVRGARVASSSIDVTYPRTAALGIEQRTRIPVIAIDNRRAAMVARDLPLAFHSETQPTLVLGVCFGCNSKGKSSATQLER